MSLQSGPTSAVDNVTSAKIRSIVVDGVLEFLDRTRTDLLKHFKGFHDLEVAVNKVPLVSTTCAALQDYEVALFVRMTELFEDSHDTRKPRSIMFGIVLMKMCTSNDECVSSSPYACRLWDTCKPVWNGPVDEEQNTQECIDCITHELMSSVWDACRKEGAIQEITTTPELLKSD